MNRITSTFPADRGTDHPGFKQASRSSAVLPRFRGIPTLRHVACMALAVSMALNGGCHQHPVDAPPEVRLADSVCDHCNMIISDARWATATLVAGERGSEPRLFDDFNCQVTYELEHPELEIVGRWSHDYSTTDWMRTSGAFFLVSPALRTPMGSQVAAFATESGAMAAQQELQGAVMNFHAAWVCLGSADGCASRDSTHMETLTMSREISPTTIVREIAVTWPELIGILEDRGIDYCCGGHLELGEAAQRRGLDGDALARELAAATPDSAQAGGERDWSAASMAELADHIEATHHAFTRNALERLEPLVAKCVRAHGDDDPRLRELQAVVAAFAEDMHDHMVREERVLFPWLRRLERPTEIQCGPPWSVQRPIDCMIHDHDHAAESFRRMRELTDDLTPPPDACPTWREMCGLIAALEHDTHRHIHKENNILFPAGIKAEERRNAEEAARAMAR